MNCLWHVFFSFSFGQIEHLFDYIVTMDRISVRSVQLENLKKVLGQVDAAADDESLNTTNGSSSPSTASPPGNNPAGCWKILVYDSFCQDIIGPLLSVGDLRKYGVTLHLLIDGSVERESVPGVPVVYLVLPTEENVKRILADCTNSMYDAVYINFALPVSNSIMDFLARGIVENRCMGVIQKVFSHDAGFIPLETNLVSLRMKDAFAQYNNPSAKDADVEAVIETIVDRSVSFVLSMGVLPIVRCAPGGPAEMVARSLALKLRDSVSGDNGAGGTPMNAEGVTSSSMRRRPILLVMDRSDDISQAVRHTSGYQALVDDMLGIELNRVTVNVDGDAQSGKKTYRLDTETDAFWRAHAGVAFHEVIDAHQKELSNTVREVESVQSATAINENGGGEVGAGSLRSTIQSLPELLEKKSKLNAHANIMQCTMNEVARRNVPSFHSIEEDMMRNGYADKSALLELLRDESKTFEDKIRVAIVYIFSTQPGSSDVQEIDSVLSEYSSNHGEDSTMLMRALEHVKRAAAFRRSGENSNAMSASSDATAGSSIWNIAGQTIERARRQVQGIVGGNVWSKLASVVEAVCRDSKLTGDSSVHSKSSVNTYLYMDPKVKVGDVQLAHSSRIPQDFKTCIVLVVGGGNYAEYHSLQQYAESVSPQRRIIYAATDMVNAAEFLTQLARAG